MAYLFVRARAMRLYTRLHITTSDGGVIIDDGAVEREAAQRHHDIAVRRCRHRRCRRIVVYAEMRRDDAVKAFIDLMQI